MVTPFLKDCEVHNLMITTCVGEKTLPLLLSPAARAVARTCCPHPVHSAIRQQRAPTESSTRRLPRQATGQEQRGIVSGDMYNSRGSTVHTSRKRKSILANRGERHFGASILLNLALIYSQKLMNTPSFYRALIRVGYYCVYLDHQCMPFWLFP